MEAWRAGGRIRRLWAGDTSLWTGTDENKWLGWLNIVEQELADVDRLIAFARDVKQRGFTDLVLLGMGGSSLGPEVFGKTFGSQAGWPRFHMLDSTDPAQIKTIEQDDQSRQDAVHRLVQIRRHAGAQYFPRLFPRPRRFGAGQGQGGRTFRRGDRSGLVARETCQAARLCSYFLRRPLNRRALLRAFEVRPRAGGGDGA